MLQWLSRNIQIIDVNYIGNWRHRTMNSLPKWNSRWKRRFAWYPVKLDNGDIILFKYYWVNETYMQNPYNGAKGFIVQTRISENDRVIYKLSK